MGSSMFAGLQRREISTSHGDVVVHTGDNLVFVQRHKTLPAQTYELPHEIRHAAIAEALSSLGVTAVLGVGSVGALTPKVPPGSVVVPDDYFNVWGVRSGFSDERAHIAPSYDASLRSRILEVVREGGTEPLPGVYVQTRGPRFETKAEVRFLATLGHVVGMTGADEATHMQERKLPYAALCMVDNWANGVSPDFEISLEAFRALVKTNEHTVQTLVSRFIEEFKKKKEQQK